MPNYHAKKDSFGEVVQTPGEGVVSRDDYYRLLSNKKKLECTEDNINLLYRAPNERPLDDYSIDSLKKKYNDCPDILNYIENNIKKEERRELSPEEKKRILKSYGIPAKGGHSKKSRKSKSKSNKKRRTRTKRSRKTKRRNKNYFF